MKNIQYRYHVKDLFTGSSLGNRALFAQLDARTDLRGLWSSGDDQFYAGQWIVEISARGAPLTPGETLFEPASQTTLLSGSACVAEKQFFLPFAADAPDESPLPLRAGIYLLRLTNRGAERTVFAVRHALRFPAMPSDLFTKKPPVDQTEKRMIVREAGGGCEITTTGVPRESRVFWSVSPPEESSHDQYSYRGEYRLAVGPGETLEVPFVLAVSPDGLEEAWATVALVRDARTVLERSMMQYAEILRRTHVFTPDPVINRGLQWAKVNTVRVQHRYRLGDGFTNDPPQDIVVIRDLGWYVLGADYLTPEFCRRLLDLAGRFGMHEGGKLTEYIRANEEAPEQHDYKLNINDDTPLYIYGAFHHAASTGDEEFLRRTYPFMRRAGEWIMAQVTGGLVRCYADGTNVWGICSWRNIIDGYNLTGAVTEVNAECAYALALLGTAAATLALPDDAARYARAAAGLTEAINTQLVSETTGLYLLNIGNDGVRHHDITGDQIFPVMLGLAPDEIRRRILARLTADEFWTPYGTRTVSPQEENYDPDFGYQLVGGVWPNLTAWTAYCVRRDDPDKLVEGMLNTYRLSETGRPADFVNVVPGEFPERLHGENYKSRGMTMSPWMPPTYLWLGVEGLLGVRPTLGGLEISPSVPSRWRWVAVRDLRCKGEEITAFLYDGTLYSSRPVESAYPLRVGSLIRVASDNVNLFAIGMMLEDDLILFVAADEEAGGIVHAGTPGSGIDKNVHLLAGEAVLFHVPLNPQPQAASTAGVAP